MVLATHTFGCVNKTIPRAENPACLCSALSHSWKYNTMNKKGDIYIYKANFVLASPFFYFIITRWKQALLLPWTGDGPFAKPSTPWWFNVANSTKPNEPFLPILNWFLSGVWSQKQQNWLIHSQQNWEEKEIV